MQDSSSRSLSPGGLERKNRAETAEKTTYMLSDGGTQTEDVGRMDQDVWMGYNHINRESCIVLPAVGRVVEVPPSKGRTLVHCLLVVLHRCPFAQQLQLCQRQAVGWYLASLPVGFPGPFMVHPGYGSVLPGCSNPEVSQSGTPKPSASCKVTATGTKRTQEDGRLRTIRMVKTQFTCWMNLRL